MQKKHRGSAQATASLLVPLEGHSGLGALKAQSHIVSGVGLTGCLACCVPLSREGCSDPRRPTPPKKTTPRATAPPALPTL